MVELRTTFVLAEPPRRVPASLRVRLLLGGAGQFRPAGGRGLACLIIPGVPLAGHGLYVYHLLTGWRPF